ncbi:Glutaredoxin [Naganishia albida]|nr:Glutaredoxin [Naganishia albida]
MSGAKQLVQQEIKDNFVMVFSKSYCPYCAATKKLLGDLAKELQDGKTYKVIELDQRDDGGDIQNYIAQEYGQRTVPQIFINQEFIGGNSDLQAIKGKVLNDKLAAPKKA